MLQEIMLNWDGVSTESQADRQAAGASFHPACRQYFLRLFEVHGASFAEAIDFWPIFKLLTQTDVLLW